MFVTKCFRTLRGLHSRDAVAQVAALALAGITALGLPHAAASALPQQSAPQTQPGDGSGAGGMPHAPSSADAVPPGGASAVAEPEAAGRRIIEGSVNPYTFDPNGRDEDQALRVLLESFGSDAIEWFQHVQTLANPFFEGRAPGSRGSELTHEYVEFWFRRIGLAPAFPAESASETWTSHRQEWQVPGTDVVVEKAEVTANGRALVRGTDFEVMRSSGSGVVTAPLAFAGYGIDEGESGYTSFADGADFAGRAVILLRYEPLDAEGKSRWAPERFSEHAGMARKVAAIAQRNPAAIILVNPPGAVDGREGLETIESSAFGRRLDVPFIQLSQSAAEALIASADPMGRTLEVLRSAADDGSTRSFDMDDHRTVTIDVHTERPGPKAVNVGGVLPGRGSLANEWIIIGAHLDHVGYGKYGTRSEHRDKLHPGADDNASGTAALIVLARRMTEWMRSDSAPTDARSVLFIGFDSEENGLLGSRHYTRTPTLKLEQVQAMINLDMVGRLRGDQVTVAGVGTAEGMLDLLRPTIESSGLTVHADPSGRGPSDHQSFHNAGVPVLFLFTGSHDDYHTPSDFAYRVNPAGAVKVISLTESLARQLMVDPKKLVFRETSRSEGRDRGYASVRLGIQPGMVEEGEEGVKVEAVSDGTSAADAGVQPGDVLLAWNGVALESTNAMLENLRAHKPGDVVVVRVRRGAETLELSVTLKASTGRRARE